MKDFILFGLVGVVPGCERYNCVDCVSSGRESGFDTSLFPTDFSSEEIHFKIVIDSLNGCSTFAGRLQMTITEPFRIETTPVFSIIPN